jgi:peptidoglycan/LPS O-acetylase OafA/YrhL
MRVFLLRKLVLDLTDRVLFPDYLRGVASIGVLLFHGFEESAIPFIANGYRWVDVFLF